MILRYKIIQIKNGEGKSVLSDEEFAIYQRYRTRPRAYLMSMKPIKYSEVKTFSNFFKK